MKTLVYSVIAVLISSVSSFSQDVIQFNNGNSQNGKIIEVRQTEIVYQKSEIPNGPSYTSNKSDINYIQFANGYREVFTIQSANGNSIQAQTYVNSQPQQQTQAAPNTTYQSNTYYTQPSQPAIVPYVAPAPVFVPVVRYNYGPGWYGGYHNGGWGYGGYHHCGHHR